MGYAVARSYEVNGRLRAYIEDSDKKPSAIADKANIRRDTFSRIINGKRPLYADEIKPICLALGVPVNFLFDLDTARPPTDTPERGS